MAFSKRTWKGRQGTGLNKFSIGGASPVTIINQPDSVTDQGDALSAGNLNDLEQRIYDAFEDEATALDQHEARIENLEQKAGDYSTVQYRGTNTVPTGKAKYGLVDKIVGKSRAWNQMVNVPSLSPYSHNGVDFTPNADGSITVNGTATGGDAVFLIIGTTGMVDGHVYLLIDNLPASNNWGFCGNAYLPSRNGFYNVEFNGTILVPNGVNVSNTKVIPRVYDTTRIFGAGNEPATVADAFAQLPALGQYNAYDAGSLPSTIVSGVRTTSINLWDEDWELGWIDGAGNNSYSAVNIRSKNYIPCLPNTAYYFKSTNFALSLRFYDFNKNPIGYSTTDPKNSAYTTPANAYYMRFTSSPDGTSSYSGGDVQICLDSASEKTIYHPHHLDTLSLSTPVTLKSAGSVSEVLDVQTGKKTRPIGSVDLGTLNWGYYNGVFYASLGSGVFPMNTNNLACGKYTPIASTNLAQATNKSIWVQYGATDGTIVIDDRSFTTVGSASDPSTFLGQLQGIILYYELATPLPDESVCDPIIDNTIATEAGGTISTIQTQTPVIDNCLDAGYLTL